MSCSCSRATRRSNGAAPPYPRDIEIRVYKEHNGNIIKGPPQPGAELDRRHSLTLAELGREEATASNHPVVTESELIDPSDLVGRKVSGLLDAIMSVLVPVVYGIVMAVEGRATPALSPVDLPQFGLFLAAALPLWVLAGTRA